MHGVTTALVAFIFFCVIFPERVKNRPQFYAAFGLICLVILLDALSIIFANNAFRVFTTLALAFLQIVAMLVLFMAAGGLSWGELRDEMGNAIEVIRRGGEEKEVIIPLTGQKPKPRATDDDDDRPARVDLDAPPSTPPGSPGTAQHRSDSSSSIPME